MALLTISDGPPCLEATHDWTAFQGDIAPTINAPGPDDGGSLPRITLDEAPGFYSLPEADDQREPRTAQPGEFGLPSEVLGKPLEYRGRILGRTLVDVRGLSSQLRAAFRRRYEEGRMVVTPGSAWGTVPWSYTARVLDLAIDDKVDFHEGIAAAWQQQYTLSLRMLDPRFYVWDGDPQSISGASAATVAATNAGSDQTDPTFTVTVPAGLPDVHLENLSVLTSNGHADLWLRDVPAGTLTVDFRSRQLALDGENAAGYFDSQNTDWWDELIPGLKPGANDIRVTGGAWSMTWRHAST